MRTLTVNNLPIYNNINLNFTANPSNYMEYLTLRKQTLKRKKIPAAHQQLDMFNLEKLEGLQQNLKTLNTLSMKQIKYVLTYLKEIVTQRGCNNMCIHCYANAMPEGVYKNDGQQTRIKMEDFNNLCNDIAELNKIMGFNVFNKKGITSKNSWLEYLCLFHDADASKISLKGGNKDYDYLDLAQKIQPLTKKLIVFDTAGWEVQDKITQKRMDNIIQKYTQNPEKYKKIHFHISINPFHTMYHHSMLRKQEGKTAISNKLLDIYTTRMANVLYTFTPIIKDHPEQITFLNRCLDDQHIIEGYNTDDLLKLYDEIIQKTKKLHEQDIENGTGFIKTNTESFACITKIYNEIIRPQGITLTGRLTKTFPQLTPEYSHKNPKQIPKIDRAGIIDLNGDFYITDWVQTYKTNIKLNYSTKDNKTPTINPRLQDEVIKI